MNPQAFTNALRSRMIEAAKGRQQSMQEAGNKLFNQRAIDAMNLPGEDKAMRIAEAIRGEARGDQGRAMPMTDAVYGKGPQMSQESRRSMASSGVAAASAGGKGMTPAGTGLQDRAIAEAMANRQMPGAKEMAYGAGAKIMGALADETRTGDVARVAAVSAGGAGLTASGAALLDLMQFMTQGANAQQERDDVLPS
jgi:hypothetical protein